MTPKELALNFDNFANGGPAILTGVAPDHPFRGDRYVEEEVSGLKVTVVFPANRYRKQVVKVDDPVDTLSPLLKNAPKGESIYVGFNGFRACIYTPDRDKKKIEDEPKTFKPDAVSAKAESVHVIPAPGIEFDTVDV